MDATVRAGIDVQGTMLRYAEVEQYGTRYRLLRLGSCAFDFDVTETLAHAEMEGDVAHERMQTIGQALGDVFEGSMASQLNVVLHPPGCHSFFSAVPPDMEAGQRQERLRGEAMLLADAHREAALRLEAEAVYTETLGGGERAAWYHVLAVPEQVQKHLDRLTHALPHAAYRWRVSMQGAARAASRLERRAPEERQPEKPHTLVVGQYPTHAEYTLCRHRQWRFSYHAEAHTPEDVTYFALALLDRLDVPMDSVGRLLVYGAQATPDVLAHAAPFLGLQAEPLNPLRLVDLSLDNLEARFDAGAYVPCIGIAL